MSRHSDSIATSQPWAKKHQNSLSQLNRRERRVHIQVAKDEKKKNEELSVKNRDMELQLANAHVALDKREKQVAAKDMELQIRECQVKNLSSKNVFIQQVLEDVKSENKETQGENMSLLALQCRVLILSYPKCLVTKIAIPKFTSSLCRSSSRRSTHHQKVHHRNQHHHHHRLDWH